MSTAPRLLPAGEDAILAECADLDAALHLFDALRAAEPAGISELVPAARTVLVRLSAGADHTEVRAAILRAAATPPQARADHTDALVEIPVRYDGQDLAEVAELTGLSVAEVIARHRAAEYRVAFAGFAPGFGYLAGGDPALDVPRRSVPRTRVPAGSVALAGVFSGVYPQDAPGGWQIIGITTAPLWDLGRTPPALLQPGTRVRFVEVSSDDSASPLSEARAATPLPVDTVAADAAEPPTPMRSVSPGIPAVAPATDAGALDAALEVCSPGLQATVQDTGRPGLAALGVSAAGAVDPAALHRANRLVGNDRTAAALEVAGGGLHLRAHGPLVLALSGAAGTLRRTDRAGHVSDLAAGTPFALDDGEELRLGAPRSGARGYLAVRGGIAVPAVLGSRSRDTLAGLGPAALTPGMRLPVGTLLATAVAEARTEPALPTPGDTVPLDIVLGPRTDWFTAAALDTLLDTHWTVTPSSDRVGLRLDGPVPLERARTGELASEGVVTGALQVPASGQPVLFLSDRPLTGGYPVIAVLTAAALARAAQVPLGAHVRFRLAAAPAAPTVTPGES